jgi:hypothetical protein
VSRVTLLNAFREANAGKHEIYLNKFNINQLHIQGLSVGFIYLNAGLLASSHCALHLTVSILKR